MLERFIKKYFSFHGRVNRAQLISYDFSISMLGSAPIIGLIILYISFGLPLSEFVPTIFFFYFTFFLSALVMVIIIISKTSLLVRRLHDVDKSGYWLLLIFLPIMGWAMLFLWMYVDEASKGANRYGDIPSAKN